MALGAILLLSRVVAKRRVSDVSRDGGGKSALVRPPRAPVPVKVVNDGWHEDEKAHRRREQAYWSRSVLFAMVAGIVAAAGAIAAAGAFVQAQRQADAADDGNRPWLTVEDFKVHSMSMDADSLRAAFDVSIKNVGHSPAQNIFVAARVRLRFFEEGGYISDLKTYCLQAEMPAVQDVGIVAFPDKPVTAASPTYRSIAEFKAAFESRGGGRPFEQFSKRAPLEVIGCVLYTDSRQRLHRTSFLYELGSSDLSTPHKVEKDSMKPQQNELSGSFAD